DVVEIAEILDVVANAIDEKVGGAAVPAKHDRVPVAFAGAVGGAWNEIEHIGDRTELLILDLPLGNYAQRLGDVLNVGIRLGGGACLAHSIFDALAGDDDLALLSTVSRSFGRISGVGGGRTAEGRRGEREFQQAIHAFPWTSPEALVLLIVIRNSRI